MKLRNLFISKKNRKIVGLLSILVGTFFVANAFLLVQRNKIDETKAASNEITRVTDEVVENERIVTEFHEKARIPFITVYKYPFIEGVTAAVPPPENVSGTDYYRVTSTDVNEDTGDEVCAIALGTACTGTVTSATTGNNVCLAYHPGASTVALGSGDSSVVYCDGSPQGGICQNYSNTCVACPTCTATVACNQPIGGLYREMYTTCAAAPPGPTVELNNTVTSLSTYADLGSSLYGVSTDTGVYTWTVDAANLMALNIPFNTGATQTDFSGNSNDGTISGSPTFHLPTSGNCQVGGCLEFTSDFDVLEVTTSSSLNITSAITLEAWVKYGVSGSQKDIPILTKGGGTGYNFTIAGTDGPDDNLLYFVISSNLLTSTIAFNDNAWHHIVGTYDGSDMRLYIDGELDGVNSVVTSIDASGSNLFIGRREVLSGFDDYLPGVLDELKIYPRSVTPNQIYQLYQDGLNGVGGPTTLVSGETASGELWDLDVTRINSSGVIGSTLNSANTVTISAQSTSVVLTGEDVFHDLIAYPSGFGSTTQVFEWKESGTTQLYLANFPFNAGTTQTNFGSVATDGTLVNSPTYVEVGKVGGAISFDGVNQYMNHITMAQAQIDSNTAMMEIWVKPEGAAPSSTDIRALAPIVGNTVHRMGIYRGILNGEDKIWAESSDGTFDAVGVDYVVGEWIHIGWKHENGFLYIYKNGVLSGSVASGSASASGTMRLGYDGAAPYFQGQVDEFKIYDRIVPDNVITDSCNAGDSDNYCANGVDPGQGRGGLSTLPEFITAVGDAWTVEVTPILANGTIETADEAISNTVNITGGVELCSLDVAGTGQAGDGILTAAELDYDNTDIAILGCTFIIDGAHTFSSITLGYPNGPSGTVLTQSETTAGTVNRTILTVTGQTAINTNSIIDLDGTGFIEGYTSDGAGGSTTTGGATGNNGGAHGGLGGTPGSGNAPDAYDSFVNPTEPGSGGDDTGLSDGGGVFKLTTGTFIHEGIISANGESEPSPTSNAPGAGGTITISASGAISGSGVIRANGGDVITTAAGAASGGRIAFNFDSSVASEPSSLYTFSAYGGDNATSTTPAKHGGAGTIYIEDDALVGGDVDGQGDLIISTLITTSRYTPLASNLTLSSLTVAGEADVEVETITVLGLLSLEDSATFAHPEMISSESAPLPILNITAGSLTIEAGAQINVDGRGYIAGETADGSGNATTVGGATENNIGGSHGGSGGTGVAAGIAPVVFDSIVNPVLPGAGGDQGLDGGGVILINVGDAIIDGSVTANGEGETSPLGYGGAAGGTINLTVTGTATGAGSLTANGGDTITTISGGGGGGRISIRYDSSAASNPVTTYTVEAFGGTSTGSLAVTTRQGGAGTIYVENDATVGGDTDNEADLYVINDTDSSRTTDIGVNSTFDDLIVSGTSSHVLLADGATFSTVTIQNASFMTAESFTVGTLTLEDTSLLNHPAVESLSTFPHPTLSVTATNIAIASGASIDVTGLGYVPGETDDGSGDATTVGASTGKNGGAHGGIGGNGSAGVKPVTYDDFTMPILPGSGGDNSATPRHGGGVIRIITSTLDLDGAIKADAEQPFDTNSGGGGGGSVYITSTSTLTGTGSITANGGTVGSINTGGGGGGLIAFYYDSSFASDPATIYTFEAYGGDNTVDGSPNRIGAAGVVYIENDASVGGDVNGQGDVYVNNNLTSNFYTAFNSGLTFSNFSVQDIGRVEIETVTVNNLLSVEDTAILTHPYIASGETAPLSTLNITADSIVIEAGASIDVSQRGYVTGETSDGSGNATTSGGATNNNGGAHGGQGGDTAAGIIPSVYDSITSPLFPGSGGDNTGITQGGGAVRIVTGDFTLDGGIIANGEGEVSPVGSGGGAGGAVYIVTTGTLAGAGSITVNGGNTITTISGPGGGGRIAFYYDSSSASAPTSLYTFQSFGGDNSTSATPARHGASGTIYLEDTDMHSSGQGDLIVDNNSLASSKTTPLIYTGSPTSYIQDDLSVLNLGILSIDQPPCTTGLVLTVNGAIDLSGGGIIQDNSGGNCTTSFAALSVTPTIPAGNINTAYSESIVSPGGYLPKTFVCLDGLGGSVVACDAAAGFPTSSTLAPFMDASGNLSLTPTASGTFNFVVRVTDSDPGGAQQAEATISLFVNSAPNSPTLVSPADTSSVGSTTPTLSAQYSDPDTGDVGTTDYRISSGTSGDCLANVNIIDFGTSFATSTNNEATTYIVGTPLTHANTYNWCARNDDGQATSNSGSYTTMGSFTVNLGNPPNAPVLVSPANLSTTASLSPILSANYSDPDSGDVGVTQYRITSTSLADCLSNTNVLWTGDSAITSTNNETTQVTVGIVLTDLTTHYWCTRNNDGIFTSNSGNYTSMGEFLVDSNFVAGGSSAIKQQRAIESAPPEPELVTPEEAQAQLILSMVAKLIDGRPIPVPVHPDSILFITVNVSNPSINIASNVFVNIPFSSEIVFVPGSLKVDNIAQSDAPDRDPGQGGVNGVSVIWSQLASGATRTITFQLAFNGDILRENALASAIPPIVIEATASADNVEGIVVSNSIEIIPDAGVLLGEEPIEPEPELEPDLDPVPEPEPEPEPELAPDFDPVPQPQIPPLPPQQPQQIISPPEQVGQQQGSETIPVEEIFGEAELFLTGHAQDTDGQIEISGTTSEPNATVTIIINEILSFVVTSDENGKWSLLVNADQIGLNPGESKSVLVDVISVKENKTSNAVHQSLIVTRSQDELLVELEESVSENIVTSTLRELSSQVTEAVKQNESEIQTTLVASAPVVVIASASIWGYLPYLPTLLYHFVIWFLRLFSKKKEGEQYGVVYNSIAKEPLPLAIVRIYDKATNRLVTTEVTDKKGRYEYLLPPGSYRVEIKKPQYTFPSEIVKMTQDGDYLKVYDHDRGIEVAEGALSLPDIPVDPQDAKRHFSLANIFKKGWLTLQKAGHYLALPLLFVGAMIAVVMVYIVPSVFNWSLAILYIFMFVLQLLTREHKEKSWGVVYDLGTDAALPLTSLQLIDPEFGKVVKSRLSDYQGRFAFLPEPGKYMIKANKVGYQQADIVEGGKDRHPISGEVEIKKEGEHLKGDIAMRVSE